VVQAAAHRHRRLRRQSILAVVATRPRQQIPVVVAIRRPRRIRVAVVVVVVAIRRTLRIRVAAAVVARPRPQIRVVATRHRPIHDHG
jgi:hypothetical protein